MYELCLDETDIFLWTKTVASPSAVTRAIGDMADAQVSINLPLWWYYLQYLEYKIVCLGPNENTGVGMNQNILNNITQNKI